MLTTIEHLRARCGLDAFDTSQDTLLTALAGLVGARFERDCNRFFDRVAAAADEFSGDEVCLAVMRTPIESVASFHLKTNETDGWELQDGVDYLLIGANLVELPAPLGTRAQRLKVTYAGGYVLPGATAGAGQTALPQEIEDAVLQQCAYMFQQRDKLGLITQWDAGSSYRQWAKAEILPEVAVVITKYRRLTL